MIWLGWYLSFYRIARSCNKGIAWSMIDAARGASFTRRTGYVY